MKKISAIVMLSLMLTACGNNEKRLQDRAAELCQYVPDHELLEKSKNYMTADFYALLDTMFNLLDEEPLAHEWLFYFVTGNGGTIADYTVTEVVQHDRTHATATIEVRQQWEDGSFDSTTDVEIHSMEMEKVDGLWLMADFDGHKADCLQYIANYRKEEALRDAMREYLVKEVGPQYLQGQLCVPTILVVAVEGEEDSVAHVWCDTWVYWYDKEGDSLMFVSGGNHAGCMTVEIGPDGRPAVTAFEQTVDGAGNDASARRIFGRHYDVYQNIHSNPEVRDAATSLQLSRVKKEIWSD